MKSVTEIVVSDFDYPHPYKLTFVSQYRFVHQVAEFLVRKDDNGQIVGGLASSWEIAHERRKIRFHLRPNLYSASEVSQSLIRLLAAGQTSHSNLASQTRKEYIHVIDSLTIEIETIGDAGAILSPLVMADAAIIPDLGWIDGKSGEKLQVDWTKTQGPYIYEKGSFPLRDGEELVFHPNPKHYLFSPDQVKWVIRKQSLSHGLTFSEIRKQLGKRSFFCTLKFWDNLDLAHSPSEFLKFYQTKPNGIAFLVPNMRKKPFSDVKMRREFLRRLLSASFPLLDPKARANQIAQPGLIGHMSAEEVQTLMNSMSDSDGEVSLPILKWALPHDVTSNPAWVDNLRRSVQGESIAQVGPNYPFEPEWSNGDYDLLFTGIGMSDTDPISGATFLFSPSGVGADIPNGKAMSLLNSAKSTDDPGAVRQVIKQVFRYAMEQALIFPVEYTSNRHYYTDDVQLNIRDPFSESIRIWDVRLI